MLEKRTDDVTKKYLKLQKNKKGKVADPGFFGQIHLFSYQDLDSSLETLLTRA
jgi:hypothetical protein